MVTKKPKWGYKGRNLLGRDDVVVYSGSQIRSLAKLAKLTRKADIGEMRSRLEGAASVYRIYQNNHDALPGAGEVKAAIRGVGNLAAQLKDYLDKLDDRSWLFFWHPEGEVDAAATAGETSSRFGHTIAQMQIAEGDRIVGRLREGDIHEALTILKNYSTDALRRVPADRTGPRSGESLRIWAINIRNFWVECLGKDFTLDYQGVEPLSEAARFTVAAFKPIDAKVPNTRIFHAMRQVIKSHRNRT